MWNDYRYLYDCLTNKKILNKDISLERLASILKENLDERSTDKFLQIASNNPLRILIWAENIKNNQDLQEKINDWIKRGIWIDDYQTVLN